MSWPAKDLLRDLGLSGASPGTHLKTTQLMVVLVATAEIQE